jgi:hypothetical protein
MFVESAVVDDAIATYFGAWNEKDSERRREMLERCITPDAELVDPLGRWEGVAGFVDRIDRYHSAAPGTEVVPGKMMIRWGAAPDESRWFRIDDATDYWDGEPRT